MKLLVMLILLFVSEYFRIEKEKKERSERRRKLSQTKIELELQRKREEFEAFRKYIEAKHQDVDEVVEEVIEKNDNVIDFVQGVQRLRDNGHKYVPYERTNPLDDIRNSLSEFTVDDVLNTFYF